MGPDTEDLWCASLISAGPHFPDPQTAEDSLLPGGKTT